MEGTNDPLHSWFHLQVLVEPGNGLAEGLLLGELEVRVAQVGANGESVGNTAVEVDLPGLAGLAQGFLRLVTELGGEDLVDFCRRVRYWFEEKREINWGWVIPEAAMDRGPVTPPSSSWVTNEG